MNAVVCVLYCCLLSLGIHINKYVLTYLGFKYPTIFQGWQSFAAIIIYKCLNFFFKERFSLTPVDRSGIISLVPGFLFFTTSLVSYSKALAEIPVPIYMSICNTLPASIYILDRIAPKGRPPISPLQAVSAVISFVTGCLLVLTEAGLNFGDSAYFWLLVGVVCSGAYTLHARITDARYGSWDRLFYSSLFSVIILAPASFYLEEAFEALNFHHDRQELFLTGCLASAIFGAASNLYIVRLQQDDYFGQLHHSASCVTICLAVIILDNNLAWWQWLLVALNACFTIPLPSHIARDDDDSNFSGMVQQKGAGPSVSLSSVGIVQQA